MKGEWLRVSPAEAHALHRQGYTWVDVRSEPEFALGHPEGALNVPFEHPQGDRLVENPDFIEVMLATFSLRSELLVFCASGARSHRALEALSSLGFCKLAELSTGYSGRKDAFGRIDPGWAQSRLPQTRKASQHQGYPFLLRRSGVGGNRRR